MESDRDRLIREKAYQLWEEGGRRDGDADDHWATAERSLTTEARSAAKPGTAPGDAEAPAGPATASARKPRKALEPDATAPDAKASRGAAKGRGKGGSGA